MESALSRQIFLPRSAESDAAYKSYGKRQPARCFTRRSKRRAVLPGTGSTGGGQEAAHPTSSIQRLGISVAVGTSRLSRCGPRRVSTSPFSAKVASNLIWLCKQRLDRMKSAFCFWRAVPAARARILARSHGTCAVRTTDAGEITIMQWIVGDVILADMLPHLL